MWLAWRFVTDGGDYDEGAAARVVGVVLVLSGMLFFALLVGLIGDSIQSKLDDLKQGRNRVIEMRHTLVLGWSDKFVSLAGEVGCPPTCVQHQECRAVACESLGLHRFSPSQLAKANESEGGGVVVVLAAPRIVTGLVWAWVL